MRILIDVNHPAHVHYFRNFYALMTARGHQVFWVSRNKEIEHKLLDLYNIPFMNRGKGKNGKIGKFLYMIYADILLLNLSRKLKIDLFINFLHPYPSQVAKLLKKPSLVFSDTEFGKLHHKLTVPYATKVFTPSCYEINLGEKQVRFDGYMELAYLHPNYFKPDPSILGLLGVKEGEKYVIVRFVTLKAVHDFGNTGFTFENQRKAIQKLSKFAKVFISSEGALPEDLEKYRIKIPINRMHDALYYSCLLFGQSGTMASEAAVLGVPSFYINNNRLGYLEYQESKYGLVYNFKDSEKDQQMAIEKAVEIINNKNGKKEYGQKKEKLLADSIDTTQLMISEVLKYA